MTESPVLEALIHARVADIVDPPRAWRADMKAAFLRLPRDVQLWFASHERRRDREINRAFNEAALARQRTAAAQQRIAELEDEIAAAQQIIAEMEKPKPETTNAETETTA
jgi:hypothetical protein